MNLKLTKKAIEEKDKLTAGEISSINFSKMALGSGLYTSEELANEITELSTVKITTDIADVYQEMVDIKTDVPNIAEETVKKESQFFITSTFFNKDVEEKFEVREVGIYAISNNDEQEYLYAYYIVASTDTAIAIVQDKSIPQYIPISVNTKLSNIDEVNIAIVNDMLVVNQDEFKRYKEDIKKHIDDEDASIRTYVEEQDTDIRNTKADLIHEHNLTDTDITGILPIAKGGTGKGNGDAEFNTLRVKSLFINDKPSPRAGMPSYSTSATQILSVSGYTNRNYTITVDAWYRFDVKGGGVSSHSTVMPYGFFIRYLVRGTQCYIGSGGKGSDYAGGGSTTIKVNSEVFDMPGSGSLGGGGSAGGGGYMYKSGGGGGYGGAGGTSSSPGGKSGGIGFPFGSGGGDGLDSAGGGAGGGQSGGSSAAGTGGGLYGGNFLSDIFSTGSGGIGGFGVGAGGISGGGFGGHFAPGISMNVDFLGYTPGDTDGYCRIYKINW